jgi:hypothetical protein
VRRIVAAALALGLVLGTACSDDGGRDAEAGPPTSTTAAPTSTST